MTGRWRAAGGLAALLATLAGAAPAVAGAPPRRDPCSRTRTMRTGPTAGAYFATVAPFEHASSDRTQVFPRSCTLRELTGERRPAIALRSSPQDVGTPYSAVTRRRDQLYLYGYGADAGTEGGYVASFDTATLRQRWRTRIPDRRPPGQWSYPGVMLSHGNGFLYAVYGNVLVKLDPRTGRTLARRVLPEDPRGTGAAYNGMVVLPDGRIVTKELERGPCPASPPGSAQAGAISGLTCAAANALPTRLVVVDPRRLRILDVRTPPEPVTGRVTAGRAGGRDVVYVAGHDHLFRYRYDHGRGRLRLDRGWGPVTYRTGAQEPGTGPGLLGRWVVVQTNFLPSDAPLTVTAVDSRDSRRVFRIRPFAGVGGRSWIVSKAALDVATRTVVTHDTGAGRMAALRLDPRHGFRVRWSRPLRSLAFSALVGPVAHRQVVVPDSRTGTDQVVWLDERTGSELARTATLAPSPAPGNIVTPGFGGRFYYASATGRLWELRPVSGR